MSCSTGYLSAFERTLIYFLSYRPFREFAVALLGLVHFLSPDQESGIHGLIICGIQLLTPNNLGEI